MDVQEFEPPQVRHANVSRWICTHCPQVFTVFGNAGKPPHCPKCGVKLSVKRYNAPTKTQRASPHAWTYAEKARVERLRLKGATYRAIAAIMGLTERQVSDMMKKQRRRARLAEEARAGTTAK